MQVTQNYLKNRHQGFKFWVEMVGNNFVVVKNACKKRNWLQWVDYDQFEPKDFNKDLKEIKKLAYLCDQEV